MIEAEDNLKATLADVTVFRTWVGAADQAEALARIHIDALPDPSGEDYTKTELEAATPYALIYTAEENGWELDFTSVGSHWNYNDSGALVLRLRQFVPQDDQDSIPDAERNWKTIVRNICYGLCELSGKAGYLAFNRIRLAELVRFHPDADPEIGDQQEAIVMIDWGSKE